MQDTSPMSLGSFDAAQFNATSDSGAVQRTVDAAQDAAARGEADEAADKFEKLLATMLVREMSRTLPEGFFGEGAGSDTFDGWLQEHMGAAIADDGGLGIAESVRASILRKQAAAESDQ